MIFNKVEISIVGKGRSFDNIFIERFWKALKTKTYIYFFMRTEQICIMD